MKNSPDETNPFGIPPGTSAKIPRRQALKRVAVIGCLVVAAGLLSSCADLLGDSSSGAASSAAILNSDKLIVPGERIGPIHLGMTPGQVIDLLGKPTYVTTYPAGPHGGTIEWWKYPELNLDLWYDDTLTPRVERVGAVRYTDTPVRIYWQTDKGITFGSSTYQVEEAYGNYVPAGLGMAYPKIGLQFDVG